MLGCGPDSGPLGRPEYHWDSGFAAKHVPHLCRLVKKLIHADADKVNKHQLADRAQAGGSRTCCRPDNRTFGDGGISNPLFTELFI